jgi:hypothetical protein
MLIIKAQQNKGVRHGFIAYIYSDDMQCIYINLENAEKDPFGIFVSYTISITNLQYISTAVYMCIILMHE